MQLTFYVTDLPILTFEIDLEKRQSKLLSQDANEAIAKWVLKDRERTFEGITRRLNELSNQDLSLADLIDQIKHQGLRADFQHQIKIGIDGQGPIAASQAYPQASRDGHHIRLMPGPAFGNTNSAGYQHKGAVMIEGRPYYLKLDDITPRSSRPWADHFDYYYSSVSEAIVSAFVKALVPDLHFQSVAYDLVQVQLPGRTTTGCLAPNYVHADELEIILAEGRWGYRYTVLEDIKIYRNDIHPLPAPEALDQLISLYQAQGVPADLAQYFLVQQLGFDLITCNQDRFSNPSNYIMKLNIQSGQAVPINFDYGRCLGLVGWNDKFEAQITPDSEYYLEDVADAAGGFQRIENYLIPGNFEAKLAFLRERGYQPIKYSLSSVIAALDQVRENLKDLGPHFINFANLKMDAFIQHLQSDFCKNLLENID